MSDQIPPDDAERTWFRAQVDPVIGAEPVEDAWSQIAARARGQAPTPAASPTSQRGRWLAIAAAIAVLAGLAVVVAATRPDPTTSVTAGEGSTTGFYVPEDLPDGWQLRTAWVAAPPQDCGVSGRSWQSTQGTQAARLELTYVPCGAPEFELDTVPGPALGNGVEETELAQLDDEPATWLLRWEDDGSWSLRSEGGLSETDLIAAARAIAADPSATAAPIPGMGLTGANLAAGIPTGPTLAVSLRSPDGQLVSYHLNAPGEGPRATALTVDHPQQVEGQPLPVAVRAPSTDGDDDRVRTASTFSRGSAYVGTWPGADLTVSRTQPPPEDPGDATISMRDRNEHDRRLLEVIGRLRPATADEWQAFMATADDPPPERVRAATELAELTGPGTRTEPPATSTVPDGSEAPTTRTYQTSSPGTPVPRQDEDVRLTRLDDLELRLQMDVLGDGADGPVLRVGERAPATLVVHNPSEAEVQLTECTLALTTWGLVPDDGGTDLPERADTDCASFPEETIPAGGTIRLPIDGREPAGFVAQRPDPAGTGRFLGPLPEGTYLATVVVPGRTADVRLQLEVQVPEPACPVTDDAVAPYLGLSPSEAKDRADAAELDLVLATVDGEPVVPPEGVRCDRLNVDVWRGVVVNASIT